jgi:hypothetical protein
MLLVLAMLLVLGRLLLLARLLVLGRLLLLARLQVLGRLLLLLARLLVLARLLLRMNGYWALPYLQLPLRAWVMICCEAQAPDPPNLCTAACGVFITQRSDA